MYIYDKKFKDYIKKVPPLGPMTMWLTKFYNKNEMIITELS